MSVKVTVRLPDVVLEDLKQVTKQRGVTMTQALKDADTLDSVFICHLGSSVTHHLLDGS